MLTRGLRWPGESYRGGLRVWMVGHVLSTALNRRRTTLSAGLHCSLPGSVAREEMELCEIPKLNDSRR